MKSRVAKEFWKRYAELPKNVQQVAKKNYLLWLREPSHPSIQFKKLQSTLPVWSARCGDNYRAVGVINEDSIIWFFIGSHADYESLIKNLRNRTLPT